MADKAVTTVDTDDNKIVDTTTKTATTDALNKAADTTNDDVSSQHMVSRVEHSMGARQPDDGTYDALRAQPPLEGRDIPQVIVTAENDTPTPGEK